jgi:hypothetical protein
MGDEIQNYEEKNNISNQHRRKNTQKPSTDLGNFYPTDLKSKEENPKRQDRKLL